jgi:peptidoglycan/xylan/chitin deacetylase (PgdA/CDA1 family)
MSPGSPESTSLPSSPAVLPAAPGFPPPPARSLPHRFSLGIQLWLAVKLTGVVLFLLQLRGPGLLLYLLPDPWFFWQFIKPAASGFGPVVTGFRTEHREFWLTIDDGPDPVTTPLVLDVLDRHQARATFFVIGDQVVRFPELTAEIVRRGHAVANHTATHPASSLWRAGPRRTAREIEQCGRAILSARVPAAPYFRAPAGIKNPFLHRELSRRGLRLVAWSARGFDCTADPDTAERRILRQVRPGAIVLLHEGREDRSRVELIDRVLGRLGDQGYRAILPEPESLV